MTYRVGNKKCMCHHGRKKHSKKGCRLCPCKGYYPGTPEVKK